MLIAFKIREIHDRLAAGQMYPLTHLAEARHDVLYLRILRDDALNTRDGREMDVAGGLLRAVR
jgi:hypothetical protein